MTLKANEGWTAVRALLPAHMHSRGWEEEVQPEAEGTGKVCCTVVSSIVIVNMVKNASKQVSKSCLHFSADNYKRI